MCGIAGVLTMGPDGAPVPEGLVEAMTSVLAHRGPDGRGTFRGGRAALGHRRLSIIDLSSDAAQPMFNEDRSLVLVFNGEIYNFRELRRDLERSGHTFRSRSDSEVILHLYEEHGAACVDRLQGMFAFCLYDVREQSLFLARDRVGEKPLHYAVFGPRFYFSSEIKGILAVEGFPKRLSARGVEVYFNYVQIPAPMTIFEGISKLPPGHWMRVDARGIVTIQRYWSIDFTRKADLSPDAAVDRLHEVLADAVRRTFVSDVPVGMLLSGGVDSTLILALARESGISDLHTFTVGNLALGTGDDECVRAQKIAKRFGVPNEVFDFSQVAFDELVRAAAGCDEPIGLLEIFYLFGIVRRIRDRVKVVLTGNGADELFGGYSTYNGISRLSSALHWAAPLVSRTNAGVNALASRYYVHRNQAILRQYFVQGRPSCARETARLLQQSMAPAHYDTLLDAKLFADLTVLCNHGLSAIPDTSGMNNSVELRSPYLHPPVIDFAVSLKGSLKIRNGAGPRHNKYVLKRLLSRYLDTADVYAPKYGFGYFISVFDLMRSAWRRDTEAVVFDEAVLDLGLFDRNGIATIWQRLLANQLGMRERLIFARYVMFSTWYRQSFLPS